jgi:hypothetical protein
MKRDAGDRLHPFEGQMDVIHLEEMVVALRARDLRPPL